jgi:DNA-binding MarR family transcriptional regulator
VDNLEKQSLVKRVSSRSDRRMNMIHLTDAGRDLQDLTMAVADQTLIEALDGVSSREIELCKGVLQRVYDNLK